MPLELQEKRDLPAAKSVGKGVAKRCYRPLCLYQRSHKALVLNRRNSTVLALFVGVGID